jgi:hypothetical protein
MNRLGRTDVQKAEIMDIERLGKTMEINHFEMEIPEELRNKKEEEIISKLIISACPDDWDPDLYFHSKGSFFEKNGKEYVSVTLRRWV